MHFLSQYHYQHDPPKCLHIVKVPVWMLCGKDTADCETQVNLFMNTSDVSSQLSGTC